MQHLSLENNFFSLTWIRIIVAQLTSNLISEPFCKMSSNLLHVEQERYLRCPFCLYNYVSNKAAMNLLSIVNSM